MDKQTHRLIVLAGIGLLVLGTGACQKTVEVTDTAPVIPPKTRTATKPADGGQAVAPGSGAKTVKSASTVTPAASAKAGKKGTAGASAMAKGGSDPFQPGGLRTSGGGAPRAGAVAAPKTPTMIAYSGRRKDPFFIDWKLPVPPPYVFDEVEPIRLASDYVETPSVAPVEVREQPEMRVSGIMTGDGVFAILETAGNKVDVVKPGSSVEVSLGGQTNRTYKVVSITKDKVRLRSQVGNIIYTQEVPLSDVAVGTPARSGIGGPGGAGGTAPGFGGSGGRQGGGGPGFPGPGGGKGGASGV